MVNSTKTALGNSLKKLLENKTLDKITITDITDDCGVSRMTFYYHFKDIYDLIEWVCVEDAEKALKSQNTSKTWQEGMYNIFQLLIDNKAFAINVYHSVSRDHLEKYIYRLTEAIFMEVIDQTERASNLDLSDKKFIADFYKYAFVGIMLNWIDGNMKQDPEEIIHKLELIENGHIAGAVGIFAESR